MEIYRHVTMLDSGAKIHKIVGVEVEAPNCKKAKFNSSIVQQDRKLSDAQTDTWAHTSPHATVAHSLRSTMVIKEERDRIRMSQTKTAAPIFVVGHSLD